MEKKTSVLAPMTKDLLMKYTFIALCIVAVPSIIVFEIPALIMIIIGVVVAVACDFLLSLAMKDRGPLDVYSAAVAGLIVALSFSAGNPIPYEGQPTVPTIMDPNIQYAAVAGISALAVILFKKIQGLLGRKYVNPVAAAKLLVLAPIYATALIPIDHSTLANMSAEAVVTTYGSVEQVLIMCYGNNRYFPNPLTSLLLLKEHGWLGGASSIAVIVVGIALIITSRRYIKWRIPLTFLLTTAIISAGYGGYYGEDIILRMAYHLFIGSAIFLAFFMATDPATTPLTKTGQVIFGIGLSVLSFVFQIYLLFLGGSILALVIMNLTCPLLDRIGVPKIIKERTYCAKLPKAKKFASLRTTQCIRCGKCLYVCSGRIPTVSIKEAMEKGDWARVKKLGAGYCQQCGTCAFVCPARIDLKAAMRSARDKTKEMSASAL
jgi:electron transport complex protein RnfD